MVVGFTGTVAGRREAGKKKPLPVKPRSDAKGRRGMTCMYIYMHNETNKGVSRLADSKPGQQCVENEDKRKAFRCCCCFLSLLL